MAFKNDGVQVQEYVYDFSVDGGAQSTIDLASKAGANAIPLGAIVKGVTMKVLTAFTSGGSATLAWGNVDDADGYSGAAIAVASLTANYVQNGWTNGAALLWDDTNDVQLYVPIVDANDAAFKIVIGGAAMTAGKAVFMVEYLMPKG